MPSTASIGNQSLQSATAYAQISQQKSTVASKTVLSQNVTRQRNIAEAGVKVSLSEKSRATYNSSPEARGKVQEGPSINDILATQIYQGSNNAAKIQSSDSGSSVGRTISKFI